MSRGGRGGRGGRFGRGGFSATHDLIRDNLDDLGIDSFQHDDRVPPPLYPAIQLPEPGIPKADVFCLEKNREISLRFKNSVYHYSRDKKAEEPDKMFDIDVDNILKLERRPEEWSKYVPNELFDKNELKNKNKVNKDLNFSNLENAEKSGKPSGQDKEKNGEEEDEEGVEGEEGEEGDMDDDYMVDHYASDNDNDDYGGNDNDGEAFF